MDEESDDIDEVSSCEEESVSRVGLKVVATEPLDAIAIVTYLIEFARELRRRGKGEERCWNAGMLVVSLHLKTMGSREISLGPSGSDDWWDG